MKKNNTTRRIKPKYTIYADNLCTPNDVHASLAFSKIKKHMIDTGKMSDVEFNAMCEAIGNEAIHIWANSQEGFDYFMNSPVCKAAQKLMTAVDVLIDSVMSFDCIEDSCEETTTKKLPWYKRFWNWITRK